MEIKIKKEKSISNVSLGCPVFSFLCTLCSRSSFLWMISSFQFKVRFRLFLRFSLKLLPMNLAKLDPCSVSFKLWQNQSCPLVADSIFVVISLKVPSKWPCYVWPNPGFGYFMLLFIQQPKLIKILIWHQIKILAHWSFFIHLCQTKILIWYQMKILIWHFWFLGYPVIKTLWKFLCLFLGV